MQAGRSGRQRGDSTSAFASTREFEAGPAPPLGRNRRHVVVGEVVRLVQRHATSRSVQGQEVLEEWRGHRALSSTVAGVWHPRGVGRRSRSRSLGAVRAVFANFELRRVELAYLLFYIARWGMRVALLVFAYERGGVEETSLVAVILEVPAAVVAPMASVIGDEIRRDRALLAGYAAQAAALAGTAGAIYADAPVAFVYGLAAVATGCMTLTRPVQSALFPQLAHSPDQLVAANVVAGSISATMAFVGPVTSGVLLALGGAGLPMTVFSGLLLMSALLVVRLSRIHRPRGSVVIRSTRPPPGSAPSPASRTSDWWSVSSSGSRSSAGRWTCLWSSSRWSSSSFLPRQSDSSRRRWAREDCSERCGGCGSWASLASPLRSRWVCSSTGSGYQLSRSPWWP